MQIVNENMRKVMMKAQEAQGQAGMGGMGGMGGPMGGAHFWW